MSALGPNEEHEQDYTLRAAPRLRRRQVLDAAEVEEGDRRAVERITKTTPDNDTFATGSVRGDRAGKGRYDLLPREAIHRVAGLYERGASAYGDRNWELGQPFSRVLDSMLRHAFQAAAGMDDEDHLAAVAWNAMALMTFEERIATGQLPRELDDR